MAFLKELFTSHQAAAGAVGGAAAVAIVIPLVEYAAGELSTKYYNYGKTEFEEILKIRNLYRDHCALNEREGSLTTLFQGLESDTENNRGMPIYFQMDPVNEKQPMFFTKKVKTIMEPSAWDNHVSKASALSELSGGIKDMIGAICNYQNERNKGLVRITENFGIGGKGYYYDPTNLFFEEFKRWLVELSKAELDEKTLLVVEGRMNYLRKIDVNQVFEQSDRIETRRETVIALLENLVNTVRPVIMSTIAAEGSREHYMKLKNNINGLIRESAKFCFYVFRDTVDTPIAFKLSDMSNALGNYKKILSGTRTGQLLNKLFNSSLFNVSNNKFDIKGHSAPKLEFIVELDALLHDDPQRKDEWGALIDFRTAKTMKVFYRMHSIIEKLFLFQKISDDLFGLAGRGGDILVYGYLSPQTQEVMQFYRGLLRDLETILRELHTIADSKRHAIIRSPKKKMTKDEERWVTLFRYADDAYEKICYRWSRKTDGPDDKFSLLGESVRLVRKIEEKMDEVHTPEYKEQLLNQIQEFTKWMVLFTGRNVLPTASMAVEKPKVEVMSNVLLDVPQLPAIAPKDLNIKVRNQLVQFVHHKQPQTADALFNAMFCVREECITVLSRVCDEAPISTYLLEEIKVVFKGKKLPMNFNARDSEAFKDYNEAIEKNDEKLAEENLVKLCFRTKGFLRDYLDYRYLFLKSGIPYSLKHKGLLHAIAFHFKRNFDVFEVGKNNQLNLIDSFSCGVSLEESPPCYLLQYPSFDPRQDYPHVDSLEDSRKASGLYADLSKIGGFFNVDDNSLMDKAQKAHEAYMVLDGEARNNSLQVAIDCATKLVERNPKKPQYLMLRGIYTASVGDSAKRKLAINDFTTALEYCKADQNNLRCQILTERGITYEYAWEIDKAIADFTQVLELEPDNTAVRLRRAKLYVEEKQDAKKGMSEFAFILERHKDHLDTLKARYRAAMFIEDYEQAALDALKMKQINSEDPEIEQMVRQALATGGKAKVNK